MHVCLLYFLDIVTNYYFKAKSVDSFRTLIYGQASTGLPWR